MSIGIDPTGIANTAISPIVQTACVPITDDVGYMISCRKYVGVMRSKKRELDTARRDVKAHITRNRSKKLEIPSEVWSWLDEVEGIIANVENFPSDVISCCSLMIRHKLGRKAFKIIEAIESATRQLSLITWIDDPVPVGKASSMNASTSATSSDHLDDFPSREETFKQALKALEPDHKSHIIALCGMGGVGKTRMMERLKKVAKERKLFDYIAEAVIGEKTDPIAIQAAIADYYGIQFNETTTTARADKIREWFKEKSNGGKTKFLIVLDDVWEMVDLTDIGCPLPNQGVDLKILLTSRDEHICTEMGAEANSLFDVALLTEAEAKNLFRQYVKTSNPELNKLGEDIVTKCRGLPIAIVTMACTLKNRKKDAWEDALLCLEHHDVKSVAAKVFQTSYNNLHYENLHTEETKSIFLMCGLFPEDFNIPTEELMRYGWGLKLFDKVSSIRKARSRLNTCIERLVQTNLLIESKDTGCVKMHDLVRAFVLQMFPKADELAPIVNHASISEWPDIRSSCKTISLTCKSLSEFPTNLKFPNLLMLKLMHGDKSLKFPQDFYKEMEKLQVISFDQMMYPMLPSSPQCNTNLGVLHLHGCSLMFDCSSIGNLSNLEVLSFAGSCIERLPSTIGKLKKLRLLDLTNCYGLSIDDGVLINLDRLEELYTLVDDINGKAISFTDENCNEMAKGLKKLSTLEFQFFGNNAQPKNMLFENLEQFKISIGCPLDSSISTINTLSLDANLDEVLKSRINELFEKTEILSLCVGNMNCLEDVEVKSLSRPPQSSSFYNLRVLVVSECAELRHLFTLGVANTLSKLEQLEVDSCDDMEELIHSSSSGEETITFPKLKFLSLRGLPKLLGLCRNINIIELPQLIELILDHIPGFTSIYTSENGIETSSLFKKEVVIPKLEILDICNMENLKEIWPCEFSKSERVRLKKIEVRSCKNLVNMFPCNPMSLLHHLEGIDLSDCGSIERLFDIDFGNIGEIEESSSSSSLKNIKLNELRKLREVWRIKGANNSCLPVCGFQAVESITVSKCERFRNVFTPTNTNFDLDLGAIVEILITECGENRQNNESVESSHKQEQTEILLKEEATQVTDSISSFLVFPSSLAHSFPNLHKVELCKYKGVDVVFEIESPTTQDNQLLPYLEDLDIRSMEGMSHVWKCNWNKLFILQKQQSKSAFHNLTTINLERCKSINYLFSPLMAKLLSNLKKVAIRSCHGIEEVVSNRDDGDEENTTFISTPIHIHRTTTLFPHLDSLTLFDLHNLKCIGGGGAKDGSNEISFENSTIATASLNQIEFCEADGVSWSLCQYPREISINYCDALSSVIPCYAAGQMQKLQVLKIVNCSGMEQVFETQGMKNNKIGCDEGIGGIPRPNNVLLLVNLKILKIYNCRILEHIFTFSALKSLRQLQELTIERCWSMKVIVKEEEYDEKQTTTNTSSEEVVVFPHLKCITLVDLSKLRGFFLGMNEFQWLLLDYVMISNCPQMRVFVPGGSKAPKLKYIHTILGQHSVEECGLNFHVTVTRHYQTPFPRLFPATSEGMPLSFHNLIELKVEYNDNIEKIIPINELPQLQKLEKIHVRFCDLVEEVFEAGTNNSSGFDESEPTIFKLPILTQVKLESLDRLRYIWKSNQWTVFEFPYLTKVYIARCNMLEHVFTSSMVSSLLQLQELSITHCRKMVEVIGKDRKVVVEEEESDGKINEITLPCLKSLTLEGLPCLKGFCLGKRNRWTRFEFPNLITVHITGCRSLEHVFTSSTVGSLLQLQELHIGGCTQMVEVIGKDINLNVEEEEMEESYGKTNEITLPHLKSLRLIDLQCLEGFCLGKEDFSFPLLDTLRIEDCPAITTFTTGNSATPQLIEMELGDSSFYVTGEDINSIIKIEQEEF